MCIVCLEASEWPAFSHERALAALQALESDAVPDRDAALRLAATLLAWSEGEPSRYRCEEAAAAVPAVAGPIPKAPT